MTNNGLQSTMPAVKAELSRYPPRHRGTDGRAQFRSPRREQQSHDALPGKKHDRAVAGRGADQDRLQALAVALNVANRVHWYSDLTNGQIAYLYQRCLFLAMPSRVVNQTDVEGFGIVALEANTFGKAVLGGIAGGMSNAIRHQETGLLVDGSNPQAVADGVAQLLQPAVRQQLGQAAYVAVKQYNWRYAAEQIIAIVNGND